MKERKKVFYITACAIWAALIFLAIFTIKIPLVFGYANIGDALIFLSATFLPLPFPCIAGALGGLFADILSGYPVYAPFTFVIKAIIPLWFFLFKKAKKKWVKHIVPALLGSTTGALLYFITDLILYGSGAFASIPGNVLQGVASVILYSVLAYIVELKFKNKQ